MLNPNLKPRTPIAFIDGNGEPHPAVYVGPDRTAGFHLVEVHANEKLHSIHWSMLRKVEGTEDAT